MNKSAITDHVAKENHVIGQVPKFWKEKDIGKPGRSRSRSGSIKKNQLHEQRWRGVQLTDTMTVFWSCAQHHVTTSLMKLAVGERNVATNLDTIFRLC